MPTRKRCPAQEPSVQRRDLLCHALPQKRRLRAIPLFKAPLSLAADCAVRRTLPWFVGVPTISTGDSFLAEPADSQPSSRAGFAGICHTKPEHRPQHTEHRGCDQRQTKIRLEQSYRAERRAHSLGTSQRMAHAATSVVSSGNHKLNRPKTPAFNLARISSRWNQAQIMLSR